MKGLREKKQAKMKQNMLESAHKHDLVKENLGLEMEKKSRRFDTQDNQVNPKQTIYFLVFPIFTSSQVALVHIWNHDV
jgi:hypothetical protein